MKISATATALAAVFALGGSAIASDAAAQSRASTQGWGAAEAGPRGAYADADVGAKSRRDRADRSRSRGGRDRGGEAASSATTFGGGSIYTDRRRAAAAASTGGAATGPGSQSTSSEVDVYGFTDRQGSEAGAYGGSTAESREPRRRRD